jgi:regulatory protein RepA
MSAARKNRSRWKEYARTRAPIRYVKLLKPKDVPGGFRFRIFGPDGKPRPGIHRTRHIPPLVRPDGSEAKFTVTKGAKNCINFLPLANGKTWPEIIADKDEPIIDAESEFKGAAIAALCGLNVITASSVWGHRTTDENGNKVPVEDYSAEIFRGRKVYIAPDNDVHVSKSVQDAVIDRAALYESLGAETEIILLPPPEWDDRKRELVKLGADDYLNGQDDPIAALDALPSLPLTDPRFAKWGKHRSPPKNTIPEALRQMRPVSEEWLTEKPPALEYTWEALLPRHGVGLLVAEGGIGKTQLAGDLSVAVASGGRMLGLPTRKGKVVYVGLEDPEDVLRRRVYHYVKRRRRALPKERRAQFDEDVRKNLIVVSLVGSQFHLVDQERGAVSQARTLDDFIALLKSHGPVELTVLDPMSRLHGMDENSNSIGTALINAAERIARETPTTVLIAHHTGKANATKQLESAYSARGASGLADAARVVLRLRELSPKECETIGNYKKGDSILKLIHAKCNYAKRYHDIYLVRGDQGALEMFEPEFTNANSYDTWFAKLCDWGDHNEHRAFTKREVTEELRAQVSGETTSRDKAREFFDAATESGDIVPTGGKSKGANQTYAVRLQEDANE